MKLLHHPFTITEPYPKMSSGFLGRGWAFPPTFHEGGALVEMVEGEEDINQSLWILFSTSLNERVMNHGYGCGLSTLIFKDIDQELVNSVRGMVEDAVLRFEPRIDVQEVVVHQDESEWGLIHITLTYTVRATNNRYNLVYPFYLYEASV